jgi:hypothetical protein
VVQPLDDAGHPIRDLSPDRFDATVDGKAAAAVKIERTTTNDQPLATVLALDVSKSMVKGSALGAAADSSMALVQDMQPSDQACLITFGDSVRVLSECTVNKVYVQRTIVGLFPSDDRTLLYDGLVRAVELASKATTARAVVIALTDGRDEGSGATLEDVAERFREAGVPLYALGFGPQADARTLQRLASLTSGEYHYAAAGGELASIYRSIWDRLRNDYAFDVSVPNLGPGFHKVEVGWTFRGQRITGAKYFVVPLGPAATRWVAVAVGLIVVFLFILVIRAMWRRGRRAISPEPGPPPAPVWLEVASGPRRGQRFYLGDDPVRVGPGSEGELAARPSPELVLEVRRCVDGAFQIGGKPAQGGLRLNGGELRPDQSVRLRDGDRVAAGGSEYVFRDRRQDSERAARPRGLGARRGNSSSRGEAEPDPKGTEGAAFGQRELHSRGFRRSGPRP